MDACLLTARGKKGAGEDECPMNNLGHDHVALGDLRNFPRKVKMRNSPQVSKWEFGVGVTDSGYRRPYSLSFRWSVFRWIPSNSAVRFSSPFWASNTLTICSRSSCSSVFQSGWDGD